MNAADLKRQILMESDRLGIRKKVTQLQGNDTGLSTDDVLEIGNLFEGLTQHKGWVYLEAYILKHADPVALLMSGNNDAAKQGEARALIKLMQYIDQMIKAKNDIQAQQAKKETDAT